MRLKRRTTPPVEVVEAQDGHDVIIEGRLDVHTVPDIRDALHEVIDRGPGELRIHLDDAEIYDATGLGVLVHIHRKASRHRRRMYLFGASERTTRLVRGCRLDRILAGPSMVPAARAARQGDPCPAQTVSTLTA